MFSFGLSCRVYFKFPSIQFCVGCYLQFNELECSILVIAEFSSEKHSILNNDSPNSVQKFNFFSWKPFFRLIISGLILYFSDVLVAHRKLLIQRGNDCSGNRMTYEVLNPMSRALFIRGFFRS